MNKNLSSAVLNNTGQDLAKSVSQSNQMDTIVYRLECLRDQIYEIAELTSATKNILLGHSEEKESEATRKIPISDGKLTLIVLKIEELSDIMDFVLSNSRQTYSQI